MRGIDEHFAAHGLLSSAAAGGEASKVPCPDLRNQTARRASLRERGLIHVTAFCDANGSALAVFPAAGGAIEKSWIMALIDLCSNHHGLNG
jgi:hypothetical protein